MTRHRSASHPSRRPRRIVGIGIESLEGRALLSGVDSSASIVPAVASFIADQGLTEVGIRPNATPANPWPSTSAVTPSQILAAYGFSASSTAGAGTTIAIVDAYNDPNIKADLAAFSAFYGLPAPSLTVVNQYGQTTNLPATDPNWSLEIALDVEWAHVSAPGAKIVLVEANSAGVSDLMTAVQTAARMSNVVSMSWGGGEFSGQQSFDTAAYFANPNVTFVAASGDDGGAYGAEWPASSPDVLAVGGTTLAVASIGTSAGETAWSATGSLQSGYSGSTGGVSNVEPLPSYQASALGSGYAYGRVVPDVSMDANPSSGLPVFDSVAGLSQWGWFKVGGTSAGAPIWSGLVAGADQARAASGLGSLSSTQTLNTLYGLYSSGSTYASAFHDVTSGVNFAGYATTGYDMVTGLGSPVANAIVYAAAHPSTTISNSTVTTTPTHTVIYIVYASGVQAHGRTQPTTDQTIDTTTAVEIAIAEIAIAEMPVSTAAPAAPASTLSTGSLGVVTAGQALPNQSVRPSTTSGTTVSVSSGMIQTVYDGADFTPGPTAEPTNAPGPGDFPTPPSLDPATPMRIWDEALASIQAEADHGLVEPQAFAPWTGYDSTEEDLTEAAPQLLGAAGLAVVFWMSWSRRLAEEDDRRPRTFVIPSPSVN